MENFKKMHEDESFKKDFGRDIKNRVDEVADKYILLDERTVDFALMYVTSEAVYYDIVNSDLIDYAYKRPVMPVSPSTFYAFLRSVLLSFEGQKIAAEIKNIQAAMHSIHTETQKFAEILQTLQMHTNNTYNTMSRAATQFLSCLPKWKMCRKLGIKKKN